MIKRLYLANGHLLQALDITSNDIAVDASIAVLLDSNLNIGDHCYLTLIENEKLEVIKIRKDNSGYQVTRAQDGTTRDKFTLNAFIVYKLTASEIADAAIPVDWNIYASGYGVATVLGEKGDWEVHLEPIHADTLGGIETHTEENNLVITDRVGMFGCCDAGATGVPGIGGPFFYLTSMLYPQETAEIMTPQPKDKNGNSIPPFSPNSTWWLLTQPSMTEQYVSNGITGLDWLQFGSEKDFSSTEKYVGTSMQIGISGDWNQYGGEKELLNPTEKYIGRDNYVLEMLLFGNEVTYDRALDAYIAQNMTPLDWTLS